MLSSVVLPAPLGPMTETRSPWVTSRLTRLTACTPPNALDTSRISSSALIGRSREPAFPPAVVFDVAVALALPDSAEAQVELLDVLVLADRLGVAVQHDAARLHHVGVLGGFERHRHVLLGQAHRQLLLAVKPAHDLKDLR